jgi:hypothetical protein
VADVLIREAALATLRDAGEPLREAVLSERVVRRLGESVTPERFLAALERLVTEGHLRVAVEHDLPARDPAPFQARYYQLID